MGFLMPDRIDARLTVMELIAELQKLPPDMRVETEGCDCVGPCIGVEKWGDEKGKFYAVLLRGDD